MTVEGWDPDRQLGGDVAGPDVDGDGLQDVDHAGDPRPGRRSLVPWRRRRERVVLTDEQLDEPDDDEPEDEPAPVPARRAEPVDPGPVRLPEPLSRAAGHRVPTRARASAVARTYGPAVGKAAVWSPLTVPWWGVRQLGHAGRGLGRLLDARATWIKEPERREAARAEGVDPTVRATLTDKAADRSAARRRTFVTCTFLVAALLIVLGVISWLALLTVAALALAALVLYGRRPDPEGDAPDVVLRLSPVRAGMTLGSLSDSLQAVALRMEIDDMLVRRPTPFRSGEGFEVEVQTADLLEPKTLREFERRLGIPGNSISIIVDAADSSIRTIRITLADPLAAPVGRSDPPFDSCSVRDPALLGVCANGSPYTESFMRSHAQFIGASRSGKSSALWRFLRIVAGWYDARAFGIDMVRGPAFTALRGVLDDVAFDYDHAVRILRHLRDVAQERIERLGQLAESDDPDLDDAEENHVPTVDEPQLYGVIDELNALVTMSRQEAAEAGNRAGLGEAVELIEWLLRYGGKAAVNLVLSGQSSKATDYGTTTIRDQITIAVLFACAMSDVTRVFGTDARDNGWRPDLLRPAQGDEVRDAGKCYTMSATNDDPNVRRVFRYSLGEVRRFAREYRAYRGIGSADGGDAVVIPDELAEVARLAREGSTDRVPSDLVATALGCSQEQLAERMRERHGITTRKRRTPLAEGRAVACYLLDDVDRAIGKIG